MFKFGKIIIYIISFLIIILFAFLFFDAFNIFYLLKVNLIEYLNLSNISHTTNVSEVLEYTNFIFTIILFISGFSYLILIKNSNDAKNEIEKANKTKQKTEDLINEISNLKEEINKVISTQNENYKKYETIVSHQIQKLLISNESLKNLLDDSLLIPNLLYIQEREDRISNILNKEYDMPEKLIIAKENNKKYFYEISLLLQKNSPEIVKLYAYLVLIKYIDEDFDKYTLSNITEQNSMNDHPIFDLLKEILSKKADS